MLSKNNLGIYIHIPFCKSKCPYCDFYSVTSKNCENKYIEAVCRELLHWSTKARNRIVDTVYFGGGTPSFLSTKSIEKILSCVKENYNFAPTEVTLEVNPADYIKEDFESLYKIGVNRISIGAQSLDDCELKILGRRHNSENIYETYKNAKLSGFENISLDLILAFPTQTEKSVEKFINFCKDENIKHISAYLLKIEKGTAFYENKNDLKFLDEDASADMYLYFCDKMKKLGYNHYEVSNFSKKCFESKHNLKYWNLDEYIGIGPSAHSFFGGKRFYYDSNIDSFISNVNNEVLSENFDIETEYFMLQMRLNSGINREDYRKKLGKNMPEKFFAVAKKYSKIGLCEIKNDENIRFTDKGFLVSNYIISEILQI